MKRNLKKAAEQKIKKHAEGQLGDVGKMEKTTSS